MAKVIRWAAVLIMVGGCDDVFDLTKVDDPRAVDAALTDTVAVCDVLTGSDLVAHFRADRLAPGAVTTWLSEVGRLTLVDEGSPPQAVPAALNGHTAVRFNGIDDHLTITSFDLDVTAIFGDTDPVLTVLFVSDTHTAAFQHEGLWTLGDRARNESLISLRYCDCGQGPGVDFSVRTEGPPPQGMSIHDANALTSATAVWTAVRTTGREQLLFRNGSQVGTAVIGPAINLNTMAERTLTIGMINNSEYFMGDVVEIVIYKTALDAGSRAQAESCLGDRYGITITSP